MKKLSSGFLIVAAAISLAGCGGKGDDKLGSQVKGAADNRADALETQADNMQEQAKAIRKDGEKQSDAIDDADVNAAAMPQSQKDALINGTEKLQ
jgi:predicted small lipoprotein YifL